MENIFDSFFNSKNMMNTKNTKFKEKVQFSNYTKIVFYVFLKTILKNSFKKHKLRVCLFTFF